MVTVNIIMKFKELLLVDSVEDSLWITYLFLMPPTLDVLMYCAVLAHLVRNHHIRWLRWHRTINVDMLLEPNTVSLQ
jgi:hypothetical protein